MTPLSIQHVHHISVQRFMTIEIGYFLFAYIFRCTFSVQLITKSFRTRFEYAFHTVHHNYKRNVCIYWVSISVVAVFSSSFVTLVNFGIFNLNKHTVCYVANHVVNGMTMNRIAAAYNVLYVVSLLPSQEDYFFVCTLIGYFSKEMHSLHRILMTDLLWLQWLRILHRW